MTAFDYKSICETSAQKKSGRISPTAKCKGGLFYNQVFFIQVLSGVPVSKI